MKRRRIEVKELPRSKHITRVKVVILPDAFEKSEIDKVEERRRRVLRGSGFSNGGCGQSKADRFSRPDLLPLAGDTQRRRVSLRRILY